MTPERTRFDDRYSDPDSAEIPWERVSDLLAEAELYWLTTVREDGRPHVCPLVGLWLDDRAWFTTGAEEQKALNLAHHDQVALTTGANSWDSGTDVIVEGRARRTTERGDLERAAEAYATKYGDAWAFTVSGDAMSPPGADVAAGLFTITPTKVLAFGKDPHSQTTHLFA